MSISPLGVIDFLIFLSLSLFIQWDTNGKSASFRTKVIPLCSFIPASHSLFSKSFNLCIIVISYETSTQGECIGLTKFHAMNNCGCFRSYLYAENLMSIFYNVVRATIARFCTFWFKRIDPVSLISFYDSSTVVHFNFSITSLSQQLV